MKEIECTGLEIIEQSIKQIAENNTKQSRKEYSKYREWNNE